MRKPNNPLDPDVNGASFSFRNSSGAMMNCPEGRRSVGLFSKFAWSLPWLTRYPFWRSKEFLRRTLDSSRPRHLILLVANHFEPAWNAQGLAMDWSTQLTRLDDWMRQARAVGRAIQDCDGTPFRNTYFN